jgi:APA family basic amino acid/polyamine antiporter
VAIAGVVWLALGIAVFAVYRRSQGLDLTTTAKVVLPKPVTEHEAEYDSVLVALDVRHYTPQTIATAAKLAARRRRGIHVLVTITVPQALPIDAELPDEELAARAVIQQARLQGGRRVTGHVERVRPGQTGRLIIEEARELRAVAIVMPLPPRTGTTLFGKTVETVLTDRPCRVIIESEPTLA